MTVSDFEFGVTPFYFLRHGETHENLNGIVQGQSESELNLEGRRTAEKAALALTSIPLGSIYASPLKRSWATASIVATLTRAPLHPLPGLMERHWGIYEGQPKVMRPAETNPETVETLEDFTARIFDAMASIEGPSPVLVVAHSGVFRILCARAGFMVDRQVSVANGQVLEFAPQNGWQGNWRISMV